MDSRIQARCQEHDVVLPSSEELLAHLDTAHGGKWAPMQWEGFGPPASRVRLLLRRLRQRR